MNLHGKNLICDLDFTKEEIWDVFKKAALLKRQVKEKKSHILLKRKSLGMYFAKPSTRTRISFEVAMTQLGGHALYLGPSDLQLSRGESIADTARVFSRYVDGIMARVYAHDQIVQLARYATVPVINGLSDMYHPCQSLTDMFSIWEKRQSLSDVHLTFIGDGDNNVTHSLLLLGARLGIHMVVCSPKQFMPKEEVLALASVEGKRSGASIALSNIPNDAVKYADVIYTDVWVSMGKEETKARMTALRPYQVNTTLLSKASKEVCVMHCLPAHRGQEITDEVLDSSQSIVFDQAENRLHVQKAILVGLLA